ncbi:DNA repair protein RAD50, putative [Plasmodium knowlesi strain H]|uniref:DNA repair protein RAD50, putative n=3 Tax=Plasmodium knowlesi TaxID=5850 RepID=A0A5K1V3W6_PLAKH|nr:DNA repair protein RAD50, putative [Plasmodium knowlesi strain H]OTN64582.1 putative DNA repair protein RAD50 [Plasmodium knowlesi]CAA9989270.1 DNA repair protein RAD50, putative [Plasmodium knowlesi strain H]SBO26153.1 DNA repair protein RAD50, putative [Plasmodium knowlesi strain H]SBO26886.1 DNA repair protein RAD50, putative [Plasmodium knowlesi strain H]VVS78744.1 DNA repair protein RAD50, putative [Plasmodium knowlesi strain H]|eukprot:XP_002261616.1 DNA repair protein RAD50, putative [Plasmodium knowlesi strain H]
MTTLEKIGIQGIRSYGDEEAQELEFASPITVIYGNNGSGKSTIIECLKVSCTGDFPPNADKGKSFIHDPLISNKMNSRGKINLLLRNYNNKRIGISRSFSLFYCKDRNKKMKHTFRALDNNIIIKKGEGQDDVIITNKCLDINEHIPKLMGVSKALLENVILCHHEESLWPFSESVKIKKKFDELFGDDHFSKILDEFTKCRKVMNDELKKKEYELATLKECYDRRKNIALDIQRNEQEIEECQTIIQLDKDKIEGSLLILNTLEGKKSLLRKLTSSIDMYFAVQGKFLDDLENYKSVEEIYEEDASELEHFADLFQRDLAKCNFLIEQASNEFALLEKQTSLPINSCDEADIKQRDEICSNLFHLEKQREEAHTLIKDILNLDHVSSASGMRGKHVGKNLSGECTKVGCFIRENEHILGSLLLQWRALFGGNGPKWVFRLGRKATTVRRRDSGDYDNECNHGKSFRGDCPPGGDRTTETIAKGSFSFVEQMRRKSVRKLDLLRMEVQRNARERLHIRRRNKILTEKAKKWKRRISRMDRRIAIMQMHKDNLANCRASDESYKESCNHLDKMNQLGCVYDSIDLSETNCGEAPSHSDDDIEGKRRQLREIEKFKEHLDQIVLLGKHYEKIFNYFLCLRRLRRKVTSFLDERRDLLCELRKVPKVWRSMWEPSGYWSEEEDLEEGVDCGQECSTGEGEEREEIGGQAIRGGQDEERKIGDPMKEEYGEGNIPTRELRSPTEGTNKLTEIVEGGSCMTLRILTEAGSSNCLDGEPTHGEVFKEEVCNKRNKRTSYPGEEMHSRLKRKKVFEMETPVGQSYLNKLKDVIEQYINKYDNRMKEVEREATRLKQALILTSGALRDVSERVGRYPDILAEFCGMLGRKNFKSVEDFFTHLGQVRKDMKKMKREIVALKSKEELLSRFVQHAEGKKACPLCRGPITDVVLDGFSFLDVNRERKDIIVEIKKKEEMLTIWGGQKKELMILLGHYYREVDPLYRDSASVSGIIDSLKNEVLDLQNGVDICFGRMQEINGKYQLMKFLQDKCTHLMEMEMDILCGRDEVDAQRSEVKAAVSRLRQVLSEGKHHIESLRSILELLGGREESEQRSQQKNLRQLILEFIPNITLLCECQDVHLMVEEVSAYMENSSVIFGPGDMFTHVGAELANSVESKVHHVVLGEGKQDEAGEECTEDTKWVKEPKNEVHRVGDHCNEYGEEHSGNLYPQEGECSVNCTKRVEEEMPLLSNVPVYESTKWKVREPDEVGTLETIAMNNKKFMEAYDKLQVYTTLETMRKEQEIDLSVRMKSVIRERKEIIKRRIEEAQRSIEREKRIRECMNKAQDYMEKHRGRKNRLHMKEEAVAGNIRKMHLRDKQIGRSIRRCRNDVVLQNKLYYIRGEIVELLQRLVGNIKLDMGKREEELKQVKEKIHSNEIIQNESNEFAEKINQKREQILSLKEEKINIEKMHHHVVINMNLKRMQEKFLLHQRNFISSLEEFRGAFFSAEQKEEQLDKLNCIIASLEEVYEADSDIYRFMDESFSFLRHERELLEFVYREEDKLKEQMKLNSEAVTSLKMKEAEMKGKIELREEYINKLTTEMNSDTYDDVGKKYREKVIEIFVYRSVIGDICNFYNSFDQAIIKFHSLKMQEINLSIRNLWRRVYNSADIDYIYIKSEIQTENNGKVHQRRSYNYRVVMVKDNCELDMRGRCSSGQKVLSSIIIRLALAESFSIRCGILALDEPTTNLDKSNSKNLAALIANIVDLRKESSAFQLILITHDTHFVDVLSQYGLTNCFYKVRKNRQGYSTIVRVRE